MEHVEIGNQIWMGHNLNTDRFRNGDLIYHAKSNEEWIYAFENSVPAWCKYNNDEKNWKLYNWHAIVDSRDLAPKGWHIPNRSEWKSLIDYFGGEKETVQHIICTSSWNQSEELKKNTNRNYNFNARPSGSRLSNGDFFDVNSTASWWSKTEWEDYNDCSWIITINYLMNRLNLNLAPSTIRGGHAVRCVKNRAKIFNYLDFLNLTHKT